MRRQNVSIEHIDLAPLAARFLDYIRQASLQRLDLDIEWLHMAATLIRWKSRALLPRDPAAPPEAADPLRQEIIGQLQAHKKQLAAELARRKAEADASFSRVAEAQAPENGAEEEEERPFLSVWDLAQQARELWRWARDYRATLTHWHETFDAAPEPVTVAQMSDVLRGYLAQAATLPLDALPLLLGQPTGAHRACLFLGLLEMVRGQEIAVQQDEAGGSIWVRPTVIELFIPTLPQSISSSLLQEDYSSCYKDE